MKNWNEIKSIKEVDDIITKSVVNTQIIFKDSTHCGISAYAKSRIDDGYGHIEGKANFNYLDLLAYRNVSNYIAERLNVIHQSPQIIVIKDGKAVHSVTHHSIHPEKIAEYL
jgi:bacillithiol system protein YtxJ